MYSTHVESSQRLLQDERSSLRAAFHIAAAVTGAIYPNAVNQNPVITFSSAATVLVLEAAFLFAHP